MEKLGWRDRRISPDSGSLFQTFPNHQPFPNTHFLYLKKAGINFQRLGIADVSNDVPKAARTSAGCIVNIARLQ
ncbi:hypothetical protein [Pseudomonas monteilii]|uniref:hypothetical protein n=1 Tax=Pseudomonas monteilii TaxID=76759 RepID=UPI000F743E36|nr:hypothetical protein [Pseudomonas monteilii]